MLSRRETLSPEKRRRLTTRLAADKRLNAAYLLKEQFGQLWKYRREWWVRTFLASRTTRPETGTRSAAGAGQPEASHAACER